MGAVLWWTGTLLSCSRRIVCTVLRFRRGVAGLSTMAQATTGVPVQVSLQVSLGVFDRLDLDGTVGIVDFLNLLANWG